MAKKRNFDYFAAMLKNCDECIFLANRLNDCVSGRSFSSVYKKNDNEGDLKQVFQALKKDYFIQIDRDDILKLSAAVSDFLQKIRDLNAFYDVCGHFREVNSAVNLTQTLVHNSVSVKNMISGISYFPKFKNIEDETAKVRSNEQKADEYYTIALKNITISRSENNTILLHDFLFKLRNCISVSAEIAGISELTIIKNT